MTETEFQSNVRAAEQFRRYAKYPEAEFWGGYIRGLRSHYHGERFGTDNEHEIWSAMADNHGGDSARYIRGIGYRAGFEGISIQSAMNVLNQEGFK